MDETQDETQDEFYPFHVINEFMLPDFRLHVIQSVYAGLDRLSGERRSVINGMVKRHVQVPGFRNSAQAPSGIKAKASVSVFERRADFVAQTLQAWSDLRPELRQTVFDFLEGREWDLLPPDADRTKLPGFFTDWPEGETYDLLGEAFAQAYPDLTVEENDLRLMIVWLASRLPFEMDEEEEIEEEDEEGGPEA